MILYFLPENLQYDKIYQMLYEDKFEENNDSLEPLVNHFSEYIRIDIAIISIFSIPFEVLSINMMKFKFSTRINIIYQCLNSDQVKFKYI